jgi:hypothetical protein
LPENMVNRLPRREVAGKITPWKAALDDIQDRIQDAAPVGGRAPAFGSFRRHRFEVSPLGVRETGLIYGVFHAPTAAALKMSRRNPSRMSTHPSTILLPAIKQTTRVATPIRKSDYSDSH